MSDRRIFTDTGLLIASNYDRIVRGGRGDYVEISKKDIIKKNIRIPEDTKWRLGNNNVYYIEYRSNDTSNAKIYYQRNLVSYATYKIGYYYVGIENITCPNFGFGRYLNYDKIEIKQ